MNKTKLEMILKSNFKQNLQSEYKFLSNRKFRFDWCVPHLKIAFEYEGVFSNKSRHTSVMGYTNDCEKYNLAGLNDWTVFRFTAASKPDMLLQIIKYCFEA